MKAFSLLLKCNWLSFTKRECLFTNVVGGPFTFLDQYARGTVEAMEPGVLIELNLQVPFVYVCVCVRCFFFGLESYH